MFHPIGLSAVPATARQLAISAGAIGQGQWAYLTATNTTANEPTVTAVASYANAQTTRANLAPIIKEAKNDEELLVIDTLIDAAGIRVLRLVGSDLLIEDMDLANRVDGAFASATPGDAMVLTVSGYPTLDGASDDPGAAATVVARFERFETPAVVYRTT